MPLDQAFVDDCPYAPEALLLEEILEIDRLTGRVVAQMPVHADLPITHHQKVHPVRHPRHMSGGLMPSPVEGALAERSKGNPSTPLLKERHRSPRAKSRGHLPRGAEVASRLRSMRTVGLFLRTKSLAKPVPCSGATVFARIVEALFNTLFGCTSLKRASAPRDIRWHESPAPRHHAPTTRRAVASTGSGAPSAAGDARDESSHDAAPP